MAPTHTPPPDPDEGSARRLLYAPHGAPGSFFNPWGQIDRGAIDLLRWRFSSNPYDKSRQPDIPHRPNDGASLAGHEPGGAVTWIGHATFAIHDGPDIVLTDPHFGPRALLYPRWTEPGVPLSAIPEDAFAILSHNHYDHLDAPTARALPEGFAWYVPLGNTAWFRRRAPHLRVVELDWWESVTHGRWRLTCLPAQHWSNRLSVPRNGALWASWLLEAGGRRYYFGGDSGYFAGFAEIGRRFPGIDAAMLPIGAYEPRWFMRYQHMDPHEAHRAFLELGARYLLPMHWGTFDLTDEPLDLPPRVLAAVAEEAGTTGRIVPLAIGERWSVPAP